MNLDALLEIPTRFSAEQYLYWTRIQCSAWTAADALIVVLVLLLCNRVRLATGRRPHVFSFAALAVTLLFAPLIWIVGDGWSIFFVEMLITIPHFLLLLYAGIANLHLCPAYLAHILSSQGTINNDAETTG